MFKRFLTIQYYETRRLSLGYLNDRQFRRFIQKRIRRHSFYYNEKIMISIDEYLMMYMSFYLYLYLMKGKKITDVLQTYVNFTFIVRNKKMKQLLDKNNIDYHSDIIERRTWDRPFYTDEYIFDLQNNITLLSTPSNNTIIQFMIINELQEDDIFLNLNKRYYLHSRKLQWLYL